MLHPSDSHCWETIPHGCLTFVYMLNAQALLSDFILDYFFKDICMANNFERQKQCLPLEQRAGLFTVHYNKYNVSGAKFRQGNCPL